MSDHPESAKVIHSAFFEESGAEPNYRVHERAYHDFISTGYTVADLRLVMQHIKSENKKMNGAKHSLRLDRLLDFDYRRFDSLLTEAKAIRRNRIPKPTEKEKTLTAWRGCEPVKNGDCHKLSEFLRIPTT